ncbi:MAG: chromate transporter [Acetobacteraceae bacterium]|jgi:chromate transporter|nr:chromate transporter [Rhodopila sp.]MEA2770605.1 chromate transporter [Acetobacteraceae bacterium]
MHEAARMADERKCVEHVALAALFIAFLKVSLCSFGGGIVWARRITVEQRRWVNEEEFSEILSLCQFMPGPNVVGLAVCVGAKLRGLIGAIAAVAGFVLIPWAVGFPLGVFYLQHTHFAVLQNILGGVSAAAAGLLVATGIRMLMPHRNRPQAVVVAALAVGGMALTKLPLLVVLLSLAPISIAIAKTQSTRLQ